MQQGSHRRRERSGRRSVCWAQRMPRAKAFPKIGEGGPELLATPVDEDDRKK